MKNKERILIVDDEELLGIAIKESLQVFDDYEVMLVKSGERAIDLVEKNSVDVVIADVRLPGMNGLDLLKAVKAIDADIEVILMTAYATIETAVEAMREQAFDYLPKPLPPINELRQMVKKALDKRRLALEKNK